MATYGFCENKCKHEVYTKPEVDEKVKEIYSTEEQVIGTWIDGKPIYRKIFTGVSIMNQENAVMKNPAENVDTVVNAYGQIENSSGMKLALSGDAQSVVWANNEFTIYVNNVVDDIFQYKLVCEYTKSTD